MQSRSTGILCDSSHNIVQSGLTDTAHRGKLVYRYFSLFAKLQNSLNINLVVLQTAISLIIITLLRVNIMIIWLLGAVTRIRVDFSKIFCYYVLTRIWVGGVYEL